MNFDLKADKKFDTVIQISDIHIRLYKRHFEYEGVFNNLFNDIDEWIEENPDKEACIAVTGDLVHAKVDMSPEMIDMASRFLRRLADRFPTAIILGNHDFLQSNANRLDAITPIVNNIISDNLFYLRDSGVYKMGNLSFAVRSLLGEKENWPTPEDCEGEHNIVLYHGPIYSSMTDTGYVITSRHVEIQDFNGFDFAMLGDIHRFQTLQYPGPDRPLTAYAGSLIQQNHGETLDGHGWALWDLEKKKVYLKEVENDYGYYTLRLKEGEKTQLPKLPKNIRLRVIAEGMSSAKVTKILSAIKSKHTVIESSISHTLPVSELGKSSASGITHNVQVLDEQNKLIKDYLERVYPHMSDEVMKKVISINTKLNGEIDDDDLPKDVMWIPHEMTFSNLFSYGEDNRIVFDNMKDLIGIFAPNATGKSAAMDALCFIIHDKTPRAFRGDQIMNTNTDRCVGEFRFSIGDTEYRIRREGERKPNGRVKVEVDFERKLEDGEWESLNAGTRRDTNAVIRSYLGDYDDFILTTLSDQGQNALFIDKGQSDRKDLTGRFMGLTIFDMLYEAGLEESREVQATIKQFNKGDFSEDLSQTQKDIESKTKEYESTKEDHELVKKKLSSIQDEITELHKKTAEVEAIDIGSIEHTKSAVQSSLVEIESDIEDLYDNKKSLESRLADLEKSIGEGKSLDDIKEKKSERSSSRDKISKLRGESQALSSEISHIKKKIGWLDEHEYDPDCEYCVNNVFMKDAQEAQDELDKKTDRLTRISSLIERIEEEIAAFGDLDSDEEEIRGLMAKHSTIEKKMMKLSVEITSQESSKSNMEGQLERINDKIDLYYNNKDIIEKNKKIDEEIESLIEQKNKFQGMADSLSKSLQKLYGEIEVLKNNKKTLMTKIKEAEETQVSYDAYKAYLDAVSRNGIPYELISNALPTIESKINMLLSQIVDFQVNLEMDGKNINGVIKYDDSGSWPLELASGMERFVSGLAIRVALMSMSSLPRSNFLIIDEGLGALDGENRSHISTLFEMLKSEYKFILLISHMDVVRDIADDLISIERKNGFSRIYVE